MSVFDLGYLPGPSRNTHLERQGYQFPDPWLDMASLAMPRINRDVLRMAEYVWLKNPTVRMAASRIVRYFLTKVVTEGIDKDQKGQFDTFLENRLQGVDQLALIGDDFMAYGNSMTSMVVPFRRYLKCK